MNKIPLYDLFRNYGDIDIPPQIDMNTIVRIALPEDKIGPDSLLFITEKVGKTCNILNPDSLKDKPFATVVSKHQKIHGDNAGIIRVGNVRAALAYALWNIYGIERDKIKFIGVTGTNGKTTTATLIYKILKGCGYKVGFIGTGKIVSDNVTLTDSTYSMTTPDPTVLYPAIAKMSEDGCRYIVMEVSSHSIALGKIAPIKFEYSIFTNLDNDHLDFHASMDEYFATKLKLFESSKKGLFNLDDRYSRKAYELAKCEKFSFGIIREGDAYATEISTDLDQTAFFYREKNLIAKVKTNLTGAFNVYNSIAALRCTIDLGIKPCIAKRALERIDGIEGRMEIINGKIRVIIDYAHTPIAFYNCLKTLKSNINQKQKLISVFGCGGDRDPSKRPLFGKYAEEYSDEVIITEDNTRSEKFENIANGIVSGMRDRSRCKIIGDRESAIRYAISQAGRGDVVAIIGKGHEKYKIINDEYLPFDERRIIMSTLSELGGEYENNA